MPFRKVLSSSLFWFGIAGILVLTIGSGVTAWQWDWLHGSNPSATASTTLRNMGLLIGGGIAAVFAIWRGWVAERQSVAAHWQAKVSDQGLLNERYQRGAEMLGNSVFTVRLGGIYALQQLSVEYPEQYHVPVMQLLCAFIRHPTQSEDVGYSFRSPFVMAMREDITEAVQIIRRRSSSHIETERNCHFQLDLHESDLSRQLLRGADLSRANLLGADLSGAFLAGANLSSAELAGAIVSNQPIGREKNAEISAGIDHKNEDLSRAIFDRTLSINFLFESNLSGTSFSADGMLPAKGLLQEHLDFAFADPDNPPKLEGVLDAKTGEQLIWSGKVKTGSV